MKPSTSISACADQIGRLADAIVPLSLYNVKKIAGPKGGSVNYIRILGSFSFFVGAIAFVILMITQSANYSTETTVQTTDISSSEWTCSMASIVSDSVTLNSTSDPTELYSLIKVNELGSECYSTVDTINPCATSLVVAPTSYSQYSYGFIVAAFTPFSTGTMYFTGKSSADSIVETSFTYFYNYYSGNIVTGAGTPIDQANGIAMDANGNGWFLVEGSYENSDSFNLVQFNENTIASETPVCYAAGEAVGDCYGVLLTNDNYYSMFYLTRTVTSDADTFAFYIYRTTQDVSDALTFTTSTEDSVNSFAVWSPSANCSLQESFIYYSLSVPSGLDAIQQLYLLYQGTTTALGSEMIIVSIQVDSSNSYLYGVGSTTATDDDDATGLFRVTLADPSAAPEYFAPASDVGSFILLPDSLTLVSSQYSDFQPFEVFNLTSSTSAFVQYGYSGSAAGWSICGNASTATLPTNYYTSTCKGNGMSWQLNYANSYYLTVDQFTANARDLAQSRCNASYAEVCGGVSNLPPYICSRQLYLPFFTVLSTAIANAHLLTLILLLLSGMFLSRVGKMVDNKEVVLESRESEMHARSSRA